VRVALLSRAAHPLHAPGGLERAVYHLAIHLQARGVGTVLVTRPATHEASFPGEVVTVSYRVVPAGAHGRVLDRTLNYPGFAIRVGEAVAEMVRAGRVDVVHAQGLTALGYGRLRRNDHRLQAPLVMNPQGMEEHKTRGLKGLALTRLKALSREAAGLADRVIATDQATREEVVRHLGVTPERVVVLPNGIDADEIERSTPADPAAAVVRGFPALAAATPLLLSVGRLEAYKGFGDTLAALEDLHARDGLGARWAWAIVGDGPDRGRLTEGIGASLRPHVHLLGRIEESLLHALYARAAVFVHATHYEGSSLVTLEAMAHGVPVVATRAGGIPDKVTDGVTGRLVAPGDVGALADAIAELLADAPRRQQMGRAGHARAHADFAWPSLAARTIALYEQLLGEVTR
jgi:glycosyltransferase involved in cell wall biosynthesis